MVCRQSQRQSHVASERGRDPESPESNVLLRAAATSSQPMVYSGRLDWLTLRTDQAVYCLSTVVADEGAMKHANPRSFVG